MRILQKLIGDKDVEVYPFHVRLIIWVVAIAASWGLALGAAYVVVKVFS